MTSFDPPHDCGRCVRLRDFRNDNISSHPDWFNGPVPVWGDRDAAVAIIGLAPGLKGANRTGRPFTGDYAGDLLFQTLLKLGLAHGEYLASADDTLSLKKTVIINAVRCVPPQNKPTGPEIANCRPFLNAALDAHPKVRLILALGRIAHESVLSGLGERRASFPFAHGARHQLDRMVLYDSYHCSRYNTNTGRLTTKMFESVVADLAREALA